MTSSTQSYCFTKFLLFYTSLSYHSLLSRPSIIEQGEGLSLYRGSKNFYIDLDKRTVGGVALSGVHPRLLFLKCINRDVFHPRLLFQKFSIVLKVHDDSSAHAYCARTSVPSTTPVDPNLMLSLKPLDPNPIEIAFQHQV